MEALKTAAKLALNRLMELGGEQAAVTASRGETTELSALSGELTQLRSCTEESLVMTVMKGARRGSIRVSTLERARILAAAEECMTLLRHAEPDADWSLAETAETGDFLTGCVQPDREAMFRRSEELLRSVKTRFPHILVEQLIAEHTKGTEYYLNSVGSEFTHLDGAYCFSLEYSAHDGERCTSFFGSEVMTDRLDTPIMELGTLAYDLSACERSLNAESIGGSFSGTLLLHPNCLADFLSSAMQLYCEDDSVIEKTSLWKNRLGKQVADRRLTLSVAPLDSRIMGGERYTPEGFHAEDYVWIQNGILKSFCLSLYGERASGFPRAKNGDCCLVAEPGDTPFRELLASIERGILVGRFSGGEPAPNGDFSGVAKNSFLIEHGEIKCALNETMISGNLAELLLNITGISEEIYCDGSNALPWSVVN